MSEPTKEARCDFFNLSREELQSKMMGPGKGPSYVRSWIIETLNSTESYSTGRAASMLKTLGLTPDKKLYDVLGKYSNYLEPSLTRSWIGHEWQDKHSERGMYRGQLAQQVLERELIDAETLFATPQSMKNDLYFIGLLNGSTEAIRDDQSAQTEKLKIQELSAPITKQELPKLPTEQDSPEQSVPPDKQGQLIPSSERKVQEQSPPVVELPVTRSRKFTLVALALPLVFSIAAITLKPLRTYEIYRNQGPKAAAQYIQATIKSGNGGANLYYQSAYIDMVDGEYEAAERKIWALLPEVREAGNNFLVADCYYLQGTIAQATNNQFGALSAYGEAQRLYSNLDDHVSYFNTTIEIVKTYVSMDELNRAQVILEGLEAQEHAGYEEIPGYHLTKSMIAQRQKMYSKALEHAKKRTDLFEESNDKFGYAASLSDLGFCHLLVGELAIGDEHTKHAAAIFAELGNKRMYVFNLTNEILWYRCQGLKPNLKSIEIIQEWIDTHDEQELAFYLDLALTHQM